MSTLLFPSFFCCFFFFQSPKIKGINISRCHCQIFFLLFQEKQILIVRCSCLFLKLIAAFENYKMMSQTYIYIVK